MNSERFDAEIMFRRSLYSTSPVMKIVGEAEIENVLEETPEGLWKITSEQAGIDKEFFDEYYKGNVSLWPINWGRSNRIHKKGLLPAMGLPLHRVC